MNINRKYVVLLIIAAHYLYGGPDKSIFDPIQSYLMRYRQSINKEDIKIKDGVLQLELHGRRTNNKSLLLLGFNSVGRSFQRNNSSFHQVQIIINYEMKDTQKMVATATMQSVLLLSRGQMNPEQFFNEVSY